MFDFFVFCVKYVYCCNVLFMVVMFYEYGLNNLNNRNIIVFCDKDFDYIRREINL